MRQFPFTLKEFQESYNKSSNDNELSRLLKCSVSTIYNFRKKNNIASKFEYKCKAENLINQIIELNSKGYGNRRISKALNIPRSSLQYLSKKYKLENVAKIPLRNIELTSFQQSMIVGCLLGDASVSDNLSLNIGHGVKQREYFNHKTELLKDFDFLLYERSNKDKRTDKIYTSLQAYSRRFQNTVRMRKLFYPENKKRIPDNIEEMFDEISLSYLYMDDGNYTKYTTSIALCNFTDEDIKRFTEMLRNKWGIETTTSKTRSIRIRQKSIKTFMELISPYIIDSMKYKLHQK